MTEKNNGSIPKGPYNAVHNCANRDRSPEHSNSPYWRIELKKVIRSRRGVLSIVQFLRALWGETSGSHLQGPSDSTQKLTRKNGKERGISNEYKMRQKNESLFYQAFMTAIVLQALFWDGNGQVGGFMYLIWNSAKPQLVDSIHVYSRDRRIKYIEGEITVGSQERTGTRWSFDKHIGTFHWWVLEQRAIDTLA